MSFWPLILLSFIASFSVVATEVTTLDTPRINGTEFLVITTDETLQAALEKQYVAFTCRPRVSINGTIRENYFQNNCRAEITKFLLNNNYKTDPLFHTFTK